jgi:hypothetical protein
MSDKHLWIALFVAAVSVAMASLVTLANQAIQLWNTVAGY